MGMAECMEREKREKRVRFFELHHIYPYVACVSYKKLRGPLNRSMNL